METLNPAESVPIHRKPSNYDEMAMQQSLLFADSLKDLKNLRTQLYSAAEYFELSYTNDDQKQIVIETLKDYVVKALVNTVDHIGSVTYKVNDILDKKVQEVDGTELSVSCIEQRLRTCQEYIDREGIAQQASVMNTPRYHKRYTLPAGETANTANREHLKYQKYTPEDVDDWFQFRTAVRATLRETPTPSPSPSFRKGRSVSPSARSSRLPVGSFSFSASTTPRKELDKRSVSPHRFPLLRSGSLAIRPASKPSTRATTPNRAVEWQQKLPSAPQKSASMRVHDMRESDNNLKELQRAPSKSKRLLKSLLTRRKTKKDDMIFTYLDEY